MVECCKCIHEKTCKYPNQLISVGTAVKDIIHECVDYVPNADMVKVSKCCKCKTTE